MLVGGKEPQCGECPWMVLAWMGGREAEERQGELGVSRLLRRTGTGLTVGGLRGTGGLGGTRGDRCRLRGVGRSLSTIGLLRRRKKESEVNNQTKVTPLFAFINIHLFN